MEEEREEEEDEREGLLEVVVGGEEGRVGEEAVSAGFLLFLLTDDSETVLTAPHCMYCTYSSMVWSVSVRLWGIASYTGMYTQYTAPSVELGRVSGQRREGEKSPIFFLPSLLPFFLFCDSLFLRTLEDLSLFPLCDLFIFPFFV